MNKLALLAAPFAAVVSSPAMAQDTTTIGGFRLELLGGYDQVVAEFEEDEGKNGTGGVFGGIALGYDFPMGGNLSVGADGEFTVSTTDMEVTGIGEVKARRDLYVGGRITAAINETFNVFAKAGYTNLRVELDGDVDDEEFRAQGNLDGVRGGVGVQISNEGPSYYGLEYRYSNYEADVERHQGMLFVGYRF